MLRKVHHFGWRACREALPTKSNLLNRREIQKDGCEICKEASKSTSQVLWNCMKAQEAWENSKLVLNINKDNGISFQHLLWHLIIIEGYEEDKVARVVIIAWALWYNKNELRNEGMRKSGQAMVQWAMDYLAKYYVVVEVEEKSSSVVVQTTSWAPRFVGCFKINVDGATFSKQKVVGLGWSLEMTKEE